MTIFLFFIKNGIFIIKSDRKCAKSYKYIHKIHEAPASTANAPLLNLNLNYEKLRYKVTDF